MFYLRRGFVIDYLKEKTGYTFTEEQVKQLLPTFEGIYRRMRPLHTSSLDKFWEDFKLQKWQYVDEEGNLGGFTL